MKKGTQIKVKINKVGFKGVGIGYIEEILEAEYSIKDVKEKKILIQNTLPNEVILAEVKKNKKNYIEAKKIETITKSDLAIEPKCKHFSKCGGCKWQNLQYEEQLKIKTAHVKETLIHIGDFTESEIDKKFQTIIACEDPWHYRNKVEFSFGWDEDMKQSFGFHVGGRRYDIFDLDECFLCSEKVLNIAKSIKHFVETNKLTPFKFKENKGLLRSLIIREGKNTGEILVNLLISGVAFPKQMKEAFLESLNAFDITSVYFTNIIAKRGQRTQIKETLLKGAEIINEELTIFDHKYSFLISPSSFFQPNSIQAETLYSKAIQTLELLPNDTVLDLFCGTGTIGIIMAKNVSKVIGIELNPAAIEDAKKNASLNNERNIEFLCGDIRDVMSEGLSTDETLIGKKIIVDPPRSGLTPKMIEYIIDLKPSHLTYISCNPSTQARDLQEICKQGYAIKTIQPVDMFPHTYHIENIVALQKTA